MIVRWNDSLTTGIEEIDNQHKELIERLNNLITASKEGKGKEQVEKAANFLSDYVSVHFQTEEKYMKKYSYPGYGEHKKIHDDFVIQVGKLLEDIESASFVIKLQSTVSQWLIEHIKRTDVKMAKFLRQYS